MPRVIVQGAEELLIALQTPSPKGHMGIPALLWGAPGEGKSSFVETLEREGFPVVTLIASIHDPTDFSGLPLHEDGRVRFAPPEWTFAFEQANKGILFLDELTTAPPSVQSALLRVILERKVGFQTLPAGVRVIAAANPPDMVAGGWELSPPLRNRFVHIRWELPGNEYVNALQEGFSHSELPYIDLRAHQECVSHWKLLVSGFLRRNTNLARTSPSEEDYGFASPRTWDFAINLMASCELLGKAPKPGQIGCVVFTNLIEGCVGRGAAVALMAFLKNLRLPDPEEVLDGKVTVRPTELRDDELYVLFASLASSLFKRKENKHVQFLDATLIFLGLTHEVSQNGKVDTIFVPVKQMARQHILHYAVTVAQQSGRLPELREFMDRVFEQTPLKDYVNVLLPER